jgi:hypothetical protein
LERCTLKAKSEIMGAFSDSTASSKYVPFFISAPFHYLIVIVS